MRRKVPSEGVSKVGRGVAARRTTASVKASSTDVPLSATVASVMTREVPCVGEDMSADSLAEFLLDRQLSGVPVVNGSNQLTGFVSLFDLEREHFMRGDTEERVPLQARSRGYAYELPEGYHADPIAHATVAEVMTPTVLSIADSTPLPTAVAMMALENLEALPVLSPVGQVVGVLFSRDVVRWLAAQNGYLVPGATSRELTARANTKSRTRNDRSAH
jgi:CBS domain-containing protein